MSHRHICIHLILFFTDNVGLCLLRAKVRHQNGGHLVEEHVIQAMYKDTIPLFKKHSKLFASVSFISVTDLDIEEVTKNNVPGWVSQNDLTRYIQN
jgi:predicted ABC-type ATPase